MKSLYRYRHLISGSLLAIAVLFVSSTVFAQNVNVTRELTFGKFAMQDNDAAYDIVIQPDGSVIADPQYIFFSDPVTGEVEATGYSASTQLIINITNDNVDPIGATGPSFTADTFFTIPDPVTTDGGGNATFEVGGTLTSSGSGTRYSDDDFQGNITITVTE